MELALLTISIKKHNTTIENPTSVVPPTDPRNPKPSETKEAPTVKQSSISLINAVAFNHACQARGTAVYQFSSPNLPRPKRKATHIGDQAQDLRNIPKDYSLFVDVFDKRQSKALPEHRLYDLSINLEEGAVPPLKLLYLLSALELQTLQDFLDENMRLGII